MRVCGVELKGGEAIICLLDYKDDVFTLPECRLKLLPVSQSEKAENIRDFKFTFTKLMEDYKVDCVVILERHQKGKLAGSATSFKLETVIQLMDMPVALMTQATIKEQLKLNPVPVDFASLELKKFQKPAFTTAYVYQHLPSDLRSEP